MIRGIRQHDADVAVEELQRVVVAQHDDRPARIPIGPVLEIELLPEEAADGLVDGDGAAGPVANGAQRAEAPNALVTAPGSGVRVRSASR